MTTGKRDKKQCVISFANENGNYLKGLARLGESIKDNFDGDFLGFVGEDSIGSPKHKDNPYAFKVYCWKKAIDMGYEQILWLDSSCVAIRNIKPIFDKIYTEIGYIGQEAGHMLGNWCNDEALEYFGITRELAMTIPMIGNAGFLGLDMTTIGPAFIKLWEQAMLDGIFKGSWSNHRHDMSVSSWIWWLFAMERQRGNEWLEYATPGTTPKNETIIIQAAGM